MENVNINGEVNGVSEIEVYASLAGQFKFKVEDVAWSRLRVDLARNPRELSVYSDNRNLELARSIHDMGYDENQPLWVSKRADGFYWLMKGHRRYHALKTLIESGLPGVRGSSPVVPANPELYSRVKCQVYTGLTLREELDLLMDHGGIIRLNKKEQAMAAREMTAMGFTHEIIFRKLGMTSRSNYTNSIGKYFVLPECVLEHFLLADEKNKMPTLTQAVLKKLSDAFKIDETVPGHKVRVGGPNFDKAWEDFLVNGSEADPKMLTRKELKSLFGALSPSTDQDIIDLLQSIYDGNQLNACTAINRIKMRMKIAGDGVGTNRVTIEEGIIKPIFNAEYTAAVQATVISEEV